MGILEVCIDIEPQITTVNNYVSATIYYTAYTKVYTYYYIQYDYRYIV